MKSRACFPLFSPPLEYGHRSRTFDPTVKLVGRQGGFLLLGVSIFLILFWAIGAIWLISVRQEERSASETSVRQTIISEIEQPEIERSHQTGAENFSLFLVKPE